MAKKKSKKCAECGKRKALDDFPGNIKSADGRMKNCRPCHGAICQAGRVKSKAAREAYNTQLRKEQATAGDTAGLSKKEAAKVAAANGALQIANGVHNKRSPFKTIVKALYSQFAKEGFEVEHVEFVGDTARVRYSRTEEIKL